MRDSILGFISYTTTKTKMTRTVRGIEEQERDETDKSRHWQTAEGGEPDLGTRICHTESGVRVHTFPASGP